MITDNEIIGFAKLVEVVAFNEWNLFECSHYSTYALDNTFMFIIMSNNNLCINEVNRIFSKLKRSEMDIGFFFQESRP